VSHNISKHRLKHDEFAEDMMRTANLLRKYGTEILAVLAGVLIIVIGLVFMSQSRAKNERQAGMILGSAHAAMFSGDGQQARRAYEDIIKRFASTESAKEAMIYLGNIHFQSRDFPAALEQYQRAVKAKPGSSLLSASASSGVAACKEQAGDFSGAAGEYLNIAGRHSRDPFLAANAMLSAGRCYRAAGNIIQARVTFQKVIRQYPDDQASQKAKEALAMLPPQG
jgi:TolA-binding protein